MESVRLMADYQSFPIWIGGDNSDPRDLGLSPSLTSGLLAWSARYDATLDLDDPTKSGFDSTEDHEEFVLVGASLASRLANELGRERAVEYFDDLTGEVVPVVADSGAGT